VKYALSGLPAAVPLLADPSDLAVHTSPFLSLISWEREVSIVNKVRADLVSGECKPPLKFSLVRVHTICLRGVQQAAQQNTGIRNSIACEGIWVIVALWDKGIYISKRSSWPLGGPEKLNTYSEAALPYFTPKDRTSALCYDSRKDQSKPQFITKVRRLTSHISTISEQK
jgi:hypothetical protein